MLGKLIGAGASLLGGVLGDKATAKANKKNIQLQKDFAQQGIQWKVADARKAGIHPLYALGAQTHSFSPSVVGGTSLASGLASAGQDISRAVTANSPQSQRDRIYNDHVQALTLKGYGLENELLASQIAKTRGQIGPAIPSDGSLTIGGIKFPSNPNFSDASDVQNRLGEPAEWPYFPMVLGGDLAQKFKLYGKEKTKSHKPYENWKDVWKDLRSWMGRR